MLLWSNNPHSVWCGFFYLDSILQNVFIPSETKIQSSPWRRLKSWDHIIKLRRSARLTRTRMWRDNTRSMHAKEREERITKIQILAWQFDRPSAQIRDLLRPYRLDQTQKMADSFPTETLSCRNCSVYCCEGDIVGKVWQKQFNRLSTSELFKNIKS